MKKLRLSLQMKFLLSIILIIVPVLGIIFTWTGIQNEKQAKEQVLTQARVLSKQVILTRQWITDCGGVMVPMDSKGRQEYNLFYRRPASNFQRMVPAIYPCNGDKNAVSVFSEAGPVPISPCKLDAVESGKCAG